jgi:Ser/Thr protein kinase RdoA (MazF antagonist)
MEGTIPKATASHPTKFRRGISYSTASSERIQQLLDEYEYDGPIEAALYSRGVNDTYLLSTPTRKFALKVYRAGWRSPDAITAEVQAIQHAHTRNVGVATPIARRDGEWITYIRAPEGSRPAVLFPWAEGRPPRYTDPDHAREFGAMVARLHQAEEDFQGYSARPRLDIDCIFGRPVAIVASQLHELPTLAARLEQLARRMECRFEQIKGQLSDWGFCHGDIWAGNARIAGDKLVLFDFDSFGLGWRAFDLATYRWHARLMGSEQPRWDAFLNGYLSIRPAAEESLPFLELFMIARHLWHTAHCIGLTSHIGMAMISEEFLSNAVQFCERLEAEITSACLAASPRS